MVVKKKTMRVDNSVLGKESRVRVLVEFAHRSSMLLRAAIKPFQAAAPGKILPGFAGVRVGRDAGKPSRHTRKHATA
jgi:hypothetical protein